MALPPDETNPPKLVTDSTNGVRKENQKARIDSSPAKSSTVVGETANNKDQRKKQLKPQSLRASLSLLEKQRVDRIRSTASSEAKVEELKQNNIEARDFQEDADRRRVEAHTAYELEEMWDKQRETAESYRTSLLRKERRSS